MAYFCETLAPSANDEIESEVLFNLCRKFMLTGSGVKSTVDNINELRQCLDVLSEWLQESFKE